jgi:hypothetical protein
VSGTAEHQVATAGIGAMEVARSEPDIPADPGLFAALTHDEQDILRAHLTSGWYKQAAVYPTLAVAWWETAALLTGIHQAHEAITGARS